MEINLDLNMTAKLESAEIEGMGLEGTLGGLALMEAILLESLDDNFAVLMQQYTDEEKMKLLIQFCAAWMISETHAHKTPLPEYLQELRIRLMNQNYGAKPEA